MSTRSLTLKNGFLAWLCATPTTTLSNRVAARRTRTSWPRVSGSNVPGYTATIIGLSFECCVAEDPRAATFFQGCGQVIWHPPQAQLFTGFCNAANAVKA